MAYSPAMVHHGTLRWIGRGWQKKELKLKRRGLGKDPTAAAWGWTSELHHQFRKIHLSTRRVPIVAVYIMNKGRAWILEAGCGEVRFHSLL